MVFGIGRRKEVLDERNDEGRTTRSRSGSEISRQNVNMDSPRSRRRLREIIQTAVPSSIIRSPVNSSRHTSSHTSSRSSSRTFSNTSSHTSSHTSSQTSSQTSSRTTSSSARDPLTANPRRSVRTTQAAPHQERTNNQERIRSRNSSTRSNNQEPTNNPRSNNPSRTNTPRSNNQTRTNTPSSNNQSHSNTPRSNNQSQTNTPRSNNQSQTNTQGSPATEFNIDGTNILSMFQGLAQFNNLRSREFTEENIAELQRTAIHLQGIFEQSLRNVFLNVSIPSERESPPTDEYNTIDEEIPPYNVTLHKYLDRISFDPRFSPVLRINRKLVKSSKDLSNSIEEFQSFNLLPSTIDPWAISHVDDSEFEDMIPSLIQIETDSHHEPNEVEEEEVDQEVLDRVIATSLLESEFYRTIPSQPPRYRKRWLQTRI